MKNECEIQEDEEPVKRRRLRVTDPDFEAPDGGWGWMIVLAAGASNLCTFHVLQQFGIMFRDRFATLGISGSQTTTIINMNAALTACVGLLNGPMFRYFTFRKVSFVGAIVCAISLISLIFATTFFEYLFSFSFLYGVGMGISSSANALALNTYFKKRRRVATGFSWTATGLGPIIFPHFMSFILELYGVHGALLILSGITCNAIVCACLLQPVHWHTKFNTDVIAENATPLIEVTNDRKESKIYNDLSQPEKPPSIFSSQYLFNEDDADETGYELIGPSTPMMIRANDGWYGSKHSISSNKSASKNSSQRDISAKFYLDKGNPIRIDTPKSVSISAKPSFASLSEARSRRSSFSRQFQEARKRKISSPQMTEKIEELIEDNHCASMKNLVIPRIEIQYSNGHSQSHETEVLNKACEKLEKLITDDDNSNKDVPTDDNITKEVETPLLVIEEGKPATKGDIKSILVVKKVENNKNIDPKFEKEVSKKLFDKDSKDEEDERSKLPFLQKLIIFFDLDLLKDPIYINIMMGVTLGGFAELNFSILTPFVLGDFGFTKQETATFMSILAGVDISIRFFIPFIAGKIGWDNRTFFLVGISMMALGRIILAHTQSYTVSLALALLIGVGKGLRTIFMALAIPTYVPLVRLPAATGLHLMFSGLFSFAVGPIIGWIRDATHSYVFTLHCLNIITFYVVISWTLERFIVNYISKKSIVEKNNQIA